LKSTALNDPSTQDATGDIIAYHDRTKHHPERYANGPGGLDWANQPDPFRRFSGAPAVRLPLAGPDETPPAADLRLTSPSSVLLRGKGRRERICPLWPETAQLLNIHLEENGVDPNRPEVIFRNHCGAPLTRFGVRVILRKYI
jgi:hypothetical protein